MAQQRSFPSLAMHAVTALAIVVMAACSDDDPESSGSTQTTTDETTTTTTAEPSGPRGPIVFQRLDPGKEPGEEDLYTVNADGSDVRLLFEGAEHASWSPDGTEVAVFCCDDGMAGHFVDVATGELRTTPQPDETLELFCGFGWSPDGERVACEGYGADDPELNGMYTIRASDGGDPQRITSNPGGSDIAGGYSPDGKQIVFIRGQDEEPPSGYFVVNVDGSGLRQISPPGMVLDDSGFGGRFSPSGDQILFVAKSAAEDHKAIWIVDAEGGAPEQLPITPGCGGPLTAGEFGCYAPSWSPDGEQIVFTRNDAPTDDSGERIYIVNADGSGLVQISDGKDDLPTWGTPAD